MNNCDSFRVAAKRHHHSRKAEDAAAKPGEPAPEKGRHALSEVDGADHADGKLKKSRP